MKKGLLSLVLVLATITGFGQCDPVNGINENFDTWEGNPFGGDMAIGECWSTIPNGGYVYGDTNVTFYAFMSPNLDMYLISPEIVEGDYDLSFDAGVIGDIVDGISIQVGTVSGNSDASSFTAIGDAVTLTSDAQTLNFSLTTTATNKYIAFKVMTTTPHSAAGIDNVVLSPSLGVSDIDAVKVSLYPNPVVNELNLTAKETIKEVKIFSMNGQLVQDAKFNNNSATVNMSALKTGVYVAQVLTAKGIQTVKVVKK